MFKFLTKLILNKPIKVVLITLVLILIFAVGVRNIQMATGNETLIETDSKVYQDNLALESEFGGESIIVLFEGKETKDMLTTNNLENMLELENFLKQYDDIYTVVSPVTIIEQMSGKQYDKYASGMQEVVDGLNTMGTKLQEIGTNIKTDSAKQPSMPDGDEMMKELNNGLTKMIQGQEKLTEGTTSLIDGYSNFGTQLKEVSTNLQDLSANLQNSPELTVEKQQQAQQLQQISTQLVQVSQKMSMISENSATLPEVPVNTITGLEGIKTNLGNQVSELNKMQTTQKEQLNNLEDLADGLSDMGDKLITISDNLEAMLTYSDAVTPSIPSTQKTLDKMAYEDNGELRNIFNDLIIDDKYMLFIVKLKGNVDDSTKGEIALSIKEFLKDNPMQSLETIVSGKPVLDNAIRTSMKDSMRKMMSLSVVFMIAVLLVTFRVKWSLFPLITILIAVIGTVGVMGWLDIPVTMVSMAVFPILIGLGIDYAIQLQNRYEEEMGVIDRHE